MGNAHMTGYICRWISLHVRTCFQMCIAHMQGNSSKLVSATVSIDLVMQKGIDVIQHKIVTSKTKRVASNDLNI